jgi:hypothetical protein
MSVDVNRGEKLPIHINMTFPALPCEGPFPTLLNWTIVSVFPSLFMGPLSSRHCWTEIASLASHEYKSKVIPVWLIWLFTNLCVVWGNSFKFGRYRHVWET